VAKGDILVPLDWIASSGLEQEESKPGLGRCRRRSHPRVFLNRPGFTQSWKFEGEGQAIVVQRNETGKTAAGFSPRDGGTVFSFECREYQLLIGREIEAIQEEPF
jgi:hypothetical protein